MNFQTVQKYISLQNVSLQLKNDTFKNIFQKIIFAQFLSLPKKQKWKDLITPFLIQICAFPATTASCPGEGLRLCLLGSHSLPWSYHRPGVVPLTSADAGQISLNPRLWISSSPCRCKHSISYPSWKQIQHFKTKTVSKSSP